MTGKPDFDEQQWDTVLEGPTSAGLIAMSAEKGGSFREAFAMAKVYGEARQEHGESELLDEIAAQRPEVDRTRASSHEELLLHGLGRIREAVALVDEKASAEEAAAYRRFVASVARRVAEAKEEKGSQGGVTEREQSVLAEIDSALSSSL
jgi:chorismate mutase